MSQELNRGASKFVLIDTSFKRVAVDIIGPIEPRSERKHVLTYIITMTDFATHYPEAEALPSIETERVAEALVEMFSRVGGQKLKLML